MKSSAPPGSLQAKEESAAGSGEMEQERVRTKAGSTAHVMLQTDIAQASLVAFLLKTTRERREAVIAHVKELAPGRYVKYVPSDSYIVVIPEHIAEEVSHLQGVLAVLELPRELKLPPSLLAEVEGRSKTERTSEAHSRRGFRSYPIKDLGMVVEGEEVEEEPGQESQ
eukprot:CAMPEP_0181339424 /NCGR_PEP_ID=MMETSP1101-20121128/29250_1 /TAXON_ID=46948 /ORGANISM="Rhodomonas abbreviata, Strain Caron Lab Isolate" /LENGTH=167 /DNA_ID=CAMNT_0023450395 /DNA_START=164 /DNA_END=664 /DNA_ORIENTATION=-